MAIAHNESTELVLGQGDVYFGRFADGTMESVGEAYIGNTMQFQITRDIATLPVFDSIDGMKVAVSSPVISQTHNVKFNTDNITMHNLARWYGGEPQTVAQLSATGATETRTLTRGLYYQLGLASTPIGLRGLTNLVVRKAGAIIDLDANFEVDLDMGRVLVRPTAPDVPSGSAILFTYDVVAKNYRKILSAKKELLGSLRFLSSARHGPDRNVFLPYVHLKVEGAYDMKLDEWQNLTFTAEGRRKNSRTEYIYIDGQ